MLKFPEEYELIEFFGDAEYMSKPEDGFHCYLARDGSNNQIQFSINIFEKSAQTIVKHDDVMLGVFSQEGVSSVEIVGDSDGRYLSVEFDLPTTNSRLILRVEPKLIVRWESIRE
jgi:hypothetical protein